MTRSSSVIRPAKGPRWTRAKLVGMLLDCYGPTPRGAVDVAAVADYAGVSASTVRRWIGPNPRPGVRRPAIPKHRIEQLQRGPAVVEHRNDQRYQHALRALTSIREDRGILPIWREQGWLDHHIVAIVEVHARPWLQVAITNGGMGGLRELHRRANVVDRLTVATRFHAQVLAHDVMIRQRAWRIHPTPRRLSAGRTQVWMADAPPVDLQALAASDPVVTPR